MYACIRKPGSARRPLESNGKPAKQEALNHSHLNTQTHDISNSVCVTCPFFHHTQHAKIIMFRKLPLPPAPPLPLPVPLALQLPLIAAFKTFFLVNSEEMTARSTAWPCVSHTKDKMECQVNTPKHQVTVRIHGTALLPQ